MTPGRLYRGTVYAATLPHIKEEKYWLVVSNNQRNKNLETALAARIRSTQKNHAIRSIVVIDDGECVYGSVCCDDIEWLYPDDVRKSLGALSPKMMRKVDEGLKAAFALD